MNDSGHTCGSGGRPKRHVHQPRDDCAAIEQNHLSGGRKAAATRVTTTLTTAIGTTTC